MPGRILLVALCFTLTACDCGPATPGSVSPGSDQGSGGAGGGTSAAGGGGGSAAGALDAGDQPGTDAGGLGGAGGGGGGGGGGIVERCTPGAADGCCPLAARAGSDPDCASLQCPTWRVSAPIPLDAPSLTRSGQAALHWTGDELLIGLQEATWTNAGTPGQLLLQWRTPAAGLVREAGPLTLDPNAWPTFGTSGITVDPGSGDVFFAWMSNQNVGIDGARAFVARVALNSGALWSSPLGIYCNAIWGEGRPQPFLSGGRLIVGFGEHACTANTGTTTRTYWFDALTGGTVPEASNVLIVNDGSTPASTYGSGGLARETSTGLLHQVYGRWGEHDLRWRTIDPRPLSPTASAPQTRAIPTGNLWTHMPAAAFSGRDLGIASTEIAYGSQQPPRLTIRVGAPDAGLAASPTVLATHDHYDMKTPPHVEGTGAGFVVLDTWGPRTLQSPTLPGPAQYVTMVHHVDAQGQLLESFPLDAPGALYPDVVWAGGRLAISWVRAISGSLSGTEYQHFLKWVDCP